ncbi:AAA family ATPase [Rhodococcus sp. ANT_H53B]|uniref:AAA family ATPase n=1 Tax=Rhodococcus sp. ANT_H53B TaxID=2597357 RepID=UPI00165E9637|nr:AAA family ATPase [Rhodococcus sp. ANT_H53B]
MNSTLEFLNVQYGNTSGYAFLAHEIAGVFSETHYSWPADAEKMAADALKQSLLGEVWFSTCLMHTPKRHSGNSVERRIIHADVDQGNLDFESVEELHGFAVFSGTPGNGHIYVELNRSVSVAEFKILCGGLRDRVVGDNKIADNDLLRIPGTLNHKTDPANPVTWAMRPSGYAWEPSELAAVLGVSLDQAVAAEASLDFEAYEAAPVPHPLPASLVTVLETPNPNRSTRAASIVNECRACGLTKEQTLGVLLTQEDQLARYREKGTAFALKDVHKLYETSIGEDRVAVNEMLEEMLAQQANQPEAAPIKPAGTTFKARYISEMAPAKKKEWLAEQRIPKGQLTLLVGAEGIGKSAWWVWLVARITTGTPAPEFGITSTDPKSVALIITEDPFTTDVLPRLIAAGADLTRIRVVSQDDDGEGSPTLPDNLDRIPDDVDLVIVDAWSDTLPANLSVRDSQQARRALHPLKEWCARTDTAMLLVTHLNRMSTGNTRDAYGSTGELRKVARSTILAQREVGTDDILTVGTDKSNGGRVGVASRFQNVSSEVLLDNGDEIEIVKSVYIGQSDKSAQQQFSDDHDSSDDQGESKSCETWLRDFMVTNNGSAEATLVKKAALAEMYTVYALGKAKRSLKLSSQKSLDPNGGWLWVLPTE